MPCTSYFPGCYTHRDLHEVRNGGSWPMYTNDIAPNMSSCYPHPNVDQMRVGYHNEVLKQTMLKQEHVFREQVQELHRLYRRQRELMDEFKRRGLKEPNIVAVSHYDLILWKVSSGCASMTWQNPPPPALPWMIPAANELSIPGCKAQLPTFSSLDTSSKNDNRLENNEERKMLNLELPADVYVEIQEEKSNEVDTNLMAFDLNMPPTLFPESEISQTNIRTIEDETKPDKGNYPDKTIIQCLSEEVCKTKSKLFDFDLNSSVPEDESMERVPEIDVEGPVSPENKESSPPRSGSQENNLEGPFQISNQKEDSDSNGDLVSAAANTIVLISRKEFNQKTKASLVESLDWFAGVIVSCEANKGCFSCDGSEKEETECVVALPSQQGKRHRKPRINKKVFEAEISRSFSSLMSYGLIFRESWGKGNKRRRGTRVPATSVRLLWK